MTAESDDHTDTVVILNPKSGSADHQAAVRDRAKLLDYEITETNHAGHAVALAEGAASAGRDQIVAAGGDGTLNEVVRGVYAAEALADVTVGVVPVGTGNDFAGNVGIDTIDDAFDVLASGERRRLDLGVADGRPFVNSCVAGLTADASEETSDELKARIGVLAYAITALREAAAFDGLEVTASVHPDGADPETVWSGSALVVLVGNGRRFGHEGSTQANVEDGLLDVTIVEEAPGTALIEDRIGERLFDADSSHISRLLASSLDLSLADGDAVSFSLDGEMETFESVSLSTRRQALRFPVGERYDPTPTLD